jgi:hypothetical protein
MTTKIRVLLYSDGSHISSYALILGTRIAKAMASAVDILDIANGEAAKELSSDEIHATVDELQASDISVTVYRRPGFAAQTIIHQAHATDYDLIVVGSRGRRGIKRLLVGSRACIILKGAATSVLVVKGQVRERIESILLCSAAGPTSKETVRFAAQLAHALNASVTLLHVMSQIAVQERSQGEDLEAEAEELMARHAREGLHLEHMLKILHDEDVEAQALVRHGLVVDEILTEAKNGRFDMLIVGAHTTQDISGLLSSDLSRQIMLAANRPILIVHQD